MVEDVTFVQSLFWNIVWVYCENINIRGVTVNSFGLFITNGIDIDSSKNALIENSTLDCGDGAITLKYGRGIDGKLKESPTENVVIRNCMVIRGVGGIAFIRNVYMVDYELRYPLSGFYFKTRRSSGGGGENMCLERIHIMYPHNSAIVWDMIRISTFVGDLVKSFPIIPLNIWINSNM